MRSWWSRDGEETRWEHKLEDWSRWVVNSWNKTSGRVRRKRNSGRSEGTYIEEAQCGLCSPGTCPRAPESDQLSVWKSDNWMSSQCETSEDKVTRRDAGTQERFKGSLWVSRTCLDAPESDEQPLWKEDIGYGYDGRLEKTKRLGRTRLYKSFEYFPRVRL
jgi:hypothetical protein